MTIGAHLRASLAVVSVAAAACTSGEALPSSEAPVEPTEEGSSGQASGPLSLVSPPPERTAPLRPAPDAKAPLARPSPPSRGVAPRPGAAPGGGGGGSTDASFDVGVPDVANPPSEGGVSGAWQPVRATPPFATSPLLLTDGTVMVNDAHEASKWWRLTPDDHGSYVNGAWSVMAQFPSGYEPTFFASAVLADGRVIVMGGEYNANGQVESSLGALYDPVLDLWTPVLPPYPFNGSPWYNIGDAPSVVLPDGTFMIGSIFGQDLAVFDERTLTFSTIGAWSPRPTADGGYDYDAGIGKTEYNNSEEGWTLLPSGKVLTVDVDVWGGPTQNSELYDPLDRTWVSAGQIGVQLSAPAPTYEIGPQVLRPDGTVFVAGATGNTAVYGASGGWTPGPTFPNSDVGQYEVADGPGVLLPSGDVLCVASPGVYKYLYGSEFFEFDGAALTQVATPSNAINDASYYFRFLLLPSGQVLSTDLSQDVEIYTPTGAPDPSWAPSITTAPTTVVRGTTYALQGTQFNGLSQAVAYGDDYQAATNYPLVRLTNDATGHVFYGRTHDHSTMAVATGTTPVSTLFEAPAGAETGPSELSVVANGIASAPVAVILE